MFKLSCSRPLIRSILLGLLSLSLIGTFVATRLNGSINTASHAHAQSPLMRQSSSAPTLPHFDHIVIVVEENHSYSQIIGSSSAPYINSLAHQGALFTNSYALTHPSEPNYLALFAGSTFGLSSDACPKNFSTANLASQLIQNRLSFAGYAESLPSAGYTGCSSPGTTKPLYERKHAPWVNFASTAGAQTNLPFTSFPTTFTRLPSVAFVVPNEQDDMHTGSIATADTWLKTHLDSYVQWAKTNNSLLILTWDEDNDTSANHIPTIFVGAHVKVNYLSSTAITHYTMNHTLQAIYGLAGPSSATRVKTITDIWV